MLTMVSVLVVSSATRGARPLSWNASRTCCRPVEPRSNAISGHDAIRRYWTPKQPGGRVTRHQLTPTGVVVDGKHAYDHGTYEIAGERDGKAWGPFRGKYLVVWRREPGGWKMQLDMWNSGPEPGS